MKILHHFSCEEIEKNRPYARNITATEKARRDSYRQGLVSDLNAGLFKPEWIAFTKIGDDIIATPQNNDIAAIYKKVYKDLKRLYKVVQSDRRRIVNQIAKLCCESNPAYVTRIDIANFYGTANPDKLIEKIEADRLIGDPLLLLIKNTIRVCRENGIVGLPRGLSFSAIFAELLMRRFDRDLISRDGIYYYGRFVDDVVIFHTSPFESPEASFNAMLTREELTVNNNKSKYNIDIPLTGQVDYLGYCISAKNEAPYISITEKKVAKIFSRLRASFIRYKIDGDFELLRDRIRFIMSNYPRARTRNGNLLAGIYYNYPALTLESLHELDNQYKRLLFGVEDWLSLPASSARKLKAKLNCYKFSSGWKDRIVYDFTAKKIGRIRKAWKYDQKN